MNKILLLVEGPTEEKFVNWFCLRIGPGGV
jgi:hypothetical protein